MTYDTVAIGLNLTAANRIHLLEPQWDPSVEGQAIGRANILEIQKNKQQLASLTLESDSNESLTGRTEMSHNEAKFILGVGAKDLDAMATHGSSAQQARGFLTAEAMKVASGRELQLMMAAGQAAKNRRGNRQK
ncbi:hypothetical protein BJY01DRAFT_249956 [Aspergillus pseudoustus]|uniref:Uncharacterized protein n=1 Tax=Aspergillus pseudoustus TaxID=1810923 RepID=A0ABR4JKK6_9EURO